MAHIKIPKILSPEQELVRDGIPDIVALALGAYSYHRYMQDQGSGIAVDNATREWARYKKKMIMWFKRQRANRRKLEKQLASMVESYQLTQDPKCPLNNMAKGVVRGYFATTVVDPPAAECGKCRNTGTIRVFEDDVYIGDQFCTCEHGVKASTAPNKKGTNG